MVQLICEPDKCSILVPIMDPSLSQFHVPCNFFFPSLFLFVRLHSAAPIPPVGYHKVTKDDELSDSSDEVYSKEVMGECWKEENVTDKMKVEIGPEMKRQSTFAFEKVQEYLLNAFLLILLNIGFSILSL